MLVSYQWLNDYIDLKDITPEEVAELLTRGGLEVDHVHRFHDGIDHVVIGKVIETAPHPDADKLTICQVDTGEETSQIICGAANVVAAEYVVVAKPGAVLPGNVEIKKTTIRGEVSEGMICALDELGVADHMIPKEEQDQIIELGNDAVPGGDALDYLGLNDVILELDLTPNRADALSIIGVAYELSAILDRPIHVPDIEHGAVRKNVADVVSVTVENGEDVPYYGAKVVQKLKIGPSPKWMQMRLIGAGMRPVNNVVDITNYVMLEYGQPLHAFDFDRFGTDEVVTRKAKPGEKMITLDETERVLAGTDVVITNGTDPVALAGVMGGASSEVVDSTTTILLEAAQFDALNVRETAKRLGLRSESSMRFEKGINPQGTSEAAERAAYLLERYAEGSVLNGIVESGEMPQYQQEVEVNLGRVNQRLGTSLHVEEVEQILYRLGFTVESLGESWRVIIPARRLDLNIEEDLMEEVARIHGYDNIPSTYPIGERTGGSLTNTQKLKRKARRFLEGAGMNEAITYSLTSEAKSVQFMLKETAADVRVLMPMSAERQVLRRSLIPHLLDSVGYNKNRQQTNVAFFEMGSVFLPTPDDNLPHEELRIAGALTGAFGESSWAETTTSVDFFVVKGIVEGLAKQLGVHHEWTFQKAERAGLHPGRSAEILMGDELIGFIGELHPTVSKERGLAATYVFELNADVLFKERDTVMKYDPLPKFPGVRRDLAIVVDEKISASEVQRAIEENGGKWLRDVELFDVYEGEHLPAGKKSLAYALSFLNKEETLTDEDIQVVHEQIVSKLQSRLGATLRG
ncbi:phenylalanine--tRNA ligase subunit beta [Geomicrobium sp. JSM 1781026]|uniref:phenylalanine--tRNA ligase subunit beta n=1 Tax=Geomicrobium sp. JSM 1781026 TaxID=3344580 RepID=UPI0035BF4DCA